MNTISDEKLLELCERYGKRVLVWRRKFIGLLPEVNRRQLYKQKNCHSIFEFAAKLAGLSEEQVRLALNLEKRFENKPALHALLVEGRASLAKLARVASIATPSNEEELAEKVKLLPQKSLETLVRDERLIHSPQKIQQTLNFELSSELIQELNSLHHQGHDVSQILSELLKIRHDQIEEEKTKVASELNPTSSRYIPVKIRHILHQEDGNKCSIRTCKKPASEIHHSQRFSLTHTHDPHFLAPLCKEHHQIAHSIDQNVQANWKSP